MLKFRYYLPENGKDFLEDTANILCGPGEQTQIAIRYTSKTFVVQLFQHSFGSKVTILMAGEEGSSTKGLFRSLKEVAETTIFTG